MLFIYFTLFIFFFRFYLLNYFNNTNDHQTSSGPSSKKRRETSPPVFESEPITSITSLNDDSLAKMFKFLDIECILNIALTSKSLQPATILAYERMFAEKTVCLHNLGRTKNPSAENIKSNSHNIIITNIATALHFLRIFGSLIKHIEIYYSRLSSGYTILHSYINLYCANGLQSFRFCCKPKFYIDRFRQPFLNVHHVETFGSDLSEPMLPFDRVFPNVRELLIHGRGLSNILIGTQLRQLTSVFIGVTHVLDEKHNEFMCNLLTMNPQVKSVVIRTELKELTMSSLLKILQCSPLLEHLSITTIQTPRPVSQTQIQRFARTHPQIIELNLRNFKLTAGDVIQFVYRLRKLRRAVFHVSNLSECIRLCSALKNEWTIIINKNECSISTDGNVFYAELRRK